MSKAMTANKLTLSDLKYSDVKTLGNGAKVVYINNGEGVSPVYVQSPEMNLPFDSGTYFPDNETSGKYSLKSSMDNMDTNSQMKVFHDKLCEMDKELVREAIEKSSDWFKNQQWFKKKGSVDEKVEDNYKPMVKVSLDPETGEPNGRWAPQFQFKIVKRDGEVLCKCFDKSDSSKTPLTTSGEGAVNLETMFKKGTKVKAVLKCNGIWISNVGWGCTWRAEQIRIDVPAKFDDYAFDDSDEEEGVELTRTSSEKVTPEFVDSDEEDEDDDEEEEEEVVKKVVKRG